MDEIPVNGAGNEFNRLTVEMVRRQPVLGEPPLRRSLARKFMIPCDPQVNYLEIGPRAFQNTRVEC